MVERLRTQGVGRGVEWGMMSNIADIEARRGEFQAEMFANIGKNIRSNIERNRQIEQDQREFELRDTMNRVNAATDLYRWAESAGDNDTADRTREYLRETLLKNIVPSIKTLDAGPVQPPGLMDISAGQSLGDLNHPTDASPDIKAMAEHYAEMVRQSAQQAGMRDIDWLNKDAENWYASVRGRADDTQQQITRIMGKRTRSDADEKRLAQLRQALAKQLFDIRAAGSTYATVRRQAAAAKATTGVRTFDSVVKQYGFDPTMKSVSDGLRSAISSGSMDPEEAIKVLNDERQQRRLERESEARLARYQGRALNPQGSADKMYRSAYNSLRRVLNDDPNYAASYGNNEVRQQIVMAALNDMPISERRLLATWSETPNLIANAAAQSAAAEDDGNGEYGMPFVDENGVQHGLYRGRPYAMEIIGRNPEMFGFNRDGSSVAPYPSSVVTGDNKKVDVSPEQFDEIDSQMARDENGVIVVDQEQLDAISGGSSEDVVSVSQDELDSMDEDIELPPGYDTEGGWNYMRKEKDIDLEAAKAYIEELRNKKRGG